jgi:hypothetical protein
MANFIAYIDEAGDEGFGKLKTQGAKGGQSKWLLIGAAIVNATDDAKLVGWKRDIISQKLGKAGPDLHFINLSHDQRVVVSQEIAKLPIEAAVTFSHKVTIPGTKIEGVFKQPGYLYNYLVRWLLERVTAEVKSKPGGPHRLRLVFSRRGGTDYTKMTNYLRLLRDDRQLYPTPGKIQWDVLNPNDLEVLNHSKRSGLQFADCITSAFYAGVEPNFFGNHEPRYANTLRGNLIRKRGNALNHGVIPVPHFAKCDASPDQTAFFLSFRE